ncbi:hypothetical protein C6499_02465 [Candidatus Poribacteria bacterium]|nr:MAG: hypothetical protein C6499_02465 [Candidatus Poribacteria bacterium]
MKRNLRGKIREFIESEEGKVGVKSPLTLGVAVGGVLIAQTIIGTSARADDLCEDDDDCDLGHTCNDPFIWNGQIHQGTCY